MVLGHTIFKKPVSVKDFSVAIVFFLDDSLCFICQSTSSLEYPTKIARQFDVTRFIIHSSKACGAKAVGIILILVMVYCH